MDELIRSMTAEQIKDLFDQLDGRDGTELMEFAYDLRSAVASSLKASTHRTYRLVVKYPDDSSPGFHVEVWQKAEHLFNVHFESASISNDVALFEVKQRIDEYIEKHG